MTKDTSNIRRTVVTSLPSVSTAKAAAGPATTMLVGSALSSMALPSWPTVVLTLGVLAYDLGVRALHRRGS